MLKFLHPLFKTIPTKDIIVRYYYVQEDVLDILLKIKTSIDYNLFNVWDEEIVSVIYNEKFYVTLSSEAYPFSHTEDLISLRLVLKQVVEEVPV